METTTIEGIDAVYGGLLHPYFVPSHILAMVALSLVIGALDWRGWRTAREGLVTILHVGYLWLGAGLVLLGLSMTGAAISASAALHMLTIGAMGTMILAVMTRAILGHTGRGLTAGKGTLAVYALVTVALVFRIVNEFSPSTDLIWASAVSWSAAFALFVWIYAPMTVRPPDRD